MPRRTGACRSCQTLGAATRFPATAVSCSCNSSSQLCAIPAIATSAPFMLTAARIGPNRSGSNRLRVWLQTLQQANGAYAIGRSACSAAAAQAAQPVAQIGLHSYSAKLCPARPACASGFNRYSQAVVPAPSEERRVWYPPYRRRTVQGLVVRAESSRSMQALPNPAIELTRSGRARSAVISFSAKPALPPRAAHGER